MRGSGTVKKILLIMLCLAALLLPACRKYDPITAPTANSAHYGNWNTFLWNCQNSVAGNVTLTRDGENVVISFDGKSYSITDSNGTRTYDYLLPINHIEKNDDGYLYGDYFFLTDDPNMSYERYQKATQSSLKDHMQLILPTELVMGKVHTTNAANSYGAPQGEVESLLSQLMAQTGIYYGQNSYFTTTTTEEDGYQLHRYHYNSQPICSVSLPSMCSILTIVELDDGGFCMILKDNGETELRSYDATGNPVWQHRYPTSQELDLRYILQTDLGLYFFGTQDFDPSVEVFGDLYIAHFTLEGTLVNEKTFGGTFNEQLNHVLFSGNGFTIYGSTYSSDGDFPFSTEFASVGFSALVTFDLELFQADMDPSSKYIASQYGHNHKGAVYAGNTILQPTNADRLPAEAKVEGVLPWKSGYVIVRSYQLADYPFGSPLDPDIHHYYQLIATYYNASGQPVWQVVTPPFIR